LLLFCSLIHEFAQKFFIFFAFNLVGAGDERLCKICSDSRRGTGGRTP